MIMNKNNIKSQASKCPNRMMSQCTLAAVLCLLYIQHFPFLSHVSQRQTLFSMKIIIFMIIIMEAMTKGGATNLKVGGQCIKKWGGGVNTVKTLKFEKGEGGYDPPLAPMVVLPLATTRCLFAGERLLVSRENNLRRLDRFWRSLLYFIHSSPSSHLTGSLLGSY